MALIIKCNAINPGPDGTVQLEVDKIQSVEPVAGVVVYLWVSETKGGVGLTARGYIVESRKIRAGLIYEVNVQLDDVSVLRPLGNRDLKPYRNVIQATPIATLARKLYWHSHTKIAELDLDEEVFLAERFTSVSVVVPDATGASIVPQGNGPALTVGGAYTRLAVQDLLGVPESRRNGNWDTGYTRYKGNVYVFCNVGIPGRTGHDYSNRWEGASLIWYGKSASRANQPLMRDIISGAAPAHIFWREHNQGPFTYAGIGEPNPVPGTSPVEIHWRFPPLAGERHASVRTGRSIQDELSRMALAIQQRIQQSGKIEIGKRPTRTGSGFADLVALLERAWARQAGVCALCGAEIPVSSTNRLMQMSPDRINSQFKAYEQPNIHIVHLGCNLAKSDVTLRDWTEFLEMLRSSTPDR